MNKLIKVNKDDKVLGLIDKGRAHQGKGILHRAFSIFVVNDRGDILLQKRSKYKKLWPLFWSNTCCSHPNAKNAKETDAKNAKKNLTKHAEKRLKEEMGFTTKLKISYKFCYKASYKDKGSENELCYVLLGKYNGRKIKPDKKEVNDYKWVDLEWLKKDFKQNPSIYTPWFKKIIKRLDY